MIALAVDDERLMLDALVKAVEASPDIDHVQSFSSCTAALEWAAENPVDVAFLDISMRGMGGLVLAERLQACRPECRVVFCTGYSEYAVDAFKIHVSGYLMKPITAADVQNEIDHIKGVRVIVGTPLLTVKCFGNFEVLAGGTPLHFKRSKTMELLAYLIDRNGAAVTAKQICAVLWEEPEQESRHMNYFWQLLDDLRHTLDSADAGAVLVKTGNRYAVDPEQLECDYYQFLKDGHPPFLGEYMTQYSWAEATTGYLLNV